MKVEGRRSKAEPVAQAFLPAESPTFLSADAVEPRDSRKPAGWKTCETTKQECLRNDFAQRLRHLPFTGCWAPAGCGCLVPRFRPVS